MLKRILSSILLTASISLVLSWPLTYVGISFLSSFISIVILQFVFFYFYNDYISRKILLEEQKILVDAEKELLRQSADVLCPCDRKVKTTVPINIAERNEYTCPGCDKKIHIMVETKTALVTTPIDSPVLPNGN